MSGIDLIAVRQDRHFLPGGLSKVLVEWAGVSWFGASSLFYQCNGSGGTVGGWGDPVSSMKCWGYGAPPSVLEGKRRQSEVMNMGTVDTLCS